MKNLTIRTRMLLGFAVVIVIEVVAILYFATILSEVHEQVNGLIGLENLVEGDRDAYQSHLALANLVSGMTDRDEASLAKAKEDVLTNLQQIKDRFGVFATTYNNTDAQFQETIKKFGPSHDAFASITNEVLTLGLAGTLDQARLLFKDKYEKIFGEMRTTLNDIEEITLKKAVEDNASVTFIIKNIVLFVAIGLGILLTLTILLALFITRSISKQINVAITELASSSQQISTASVQLARSSQEIANGAIEQASSIEETSASIEELASMVKQNASNSREARALAEKTVDVSDNGFTQMERMLESMQAISQESGRIKKIMKVIDDIAFQTNILALNAAVEAARAGEAGMGFAVVAEEVKNLANRSADAAKETADMIESSITKTADGLVIAEKLSEQFKDVQDKARKLALMAREVETASRQQDIGIEQVNKAIIQFDEVVQANAGSAEETASAATELQTQVESLDDLVGQLTAVVLGHKMAEERKERHDEALKKERREMEREDRFSQKKKEVAEKSAARSSTRRSLESNGNQAAAGDAPADPEAGVRETRPEKLIPFEDDEDLKEF